MSNKRPVITHLLQLWTIIYLSVWRSSTIVAADFGDEEMSNFNRTVYFGAPYIDHNQDDVTLDVNGNFSVLCKSSGPITWHIPEHLDSSAVEINTEDSFDSGMPYASRLFIPNAEYSFVGFYYCLPIEDEESKSNIEDLVSEFKATPFYIFVNDPHNVFVETFTVIHGVEKQTVIIPCKPTSKYVTVELLKDDEESEPVQLPYDVKRGFELYLNGIGDSCTYYCRGNGTTAQIALTVSPEPTQAILNNPHIVSHENFHVFEGSDLLLNCSLEIEIGTRVNLSWVLPNNDQARKENRVEIGIKPVAHEKYPQKVTLISYLKVKSVVNHTDGGYYSCIATDFSKTASTRKMVRVIDKNSGYINVTEVSGSYRVYSKANGQVQWMLEYAAIPPAVFVLTDNRGKEIPTEKGTSTKYEFIVQPSTIQFNIKHVELKDSGIYTLTATNYVDDKEIELELVVEDKPTVLMEDVYVMEGKEAELVCKCAGYPTSAITWSFTPCSITPRWPTCHDELKLDFTEDQYRTTQVTDLSQNSTLKFHFDSPGRVSCMAINKMGSDVTTAKVIIGDLNNGLEVWGIDHNNPISVNDEVMLHCGALVYNYSGPLQWYKDNMLIVSDPANGLEILERNTKYSYRKSVHLSQVTKHDSGSYDCRATEMETDEIMSSSLELVVNDALAPHLDKSNVEDEETKIDLGETIQFECVFSGIPRPIVKWYKDGELIDKDSATYTNSTIHLYDDHTILYIKYTKPEHQGEYKCVGENKVGTVTRSTRLVMAGIPRNSKYLLYGINAIVLILLSAFLVLYYRYRKTRRILKEMKEAGLANFEEGNPECINPALSLDEQADLLPYNKDFEFPREDLKLGKQLGAGAFGIVVKAVAKGIVHYEEETTVAVKMVKPNADNEVMRALISELKIMVHLGQHVNVVNLLGAVTKDIAKRKVMVIVEYCRFGNVQNFLQKHREQFIDQIDPETDQIDATILSKDQRWSNDSGYEYNRTSRQPGNNAYIQNSVLNRMNANSGVGYEGAIDSCNTEATLISEYGADDEMLMTNNSVQPGWRSNYKMDFKGPVPTVTTSVLVGWGFQVARAMDYLSSRNILHGDLAARNVLLCDDNVVKVCDFGLARTMYNSNNYKKKGESPLPFKWLALESLTDHVFSTHSDIWSYGIVLWEFFSLAKVPYPGMNADENLYMKLRDGYRMEKPQYANQEIHDIMLECWRASPDTRPSFAQLENRLGDMLQDTVKDHYLDLNEPYLRMNTEYMKTGKRDYFSSMGPPETPAPPIPTYVNAKAEKGAADNSYLKMSPTTGKVYYENSNNGEDGSAGAAGQLNQIHLSDAMFKKSPPAINFDRKNQRQSKKPEERPMLKTLGEALSSDSEPEVSSPDGPRSNFEMSPLKSDGGRSYVNVPSTMGQKPTVINIENDYSPPKDAFSNPSYVGLKSFPERK